MSTTPRTTPPRTPRERQCAASTLDYLLISLVHHYRSQQDGPPAPAALDAVGFRLGQVLAQRLTRDRAPLVESLDAIKWVCKELWTEAFRKGVDNLRTNHRGTFVLRDIQFPWTLRLSQNLVSGPERATPNELAADFLVLPCGIIRGALAALGLESTVTADATALPQCDFTVVVHSQPLR